MTYNMTAISENATGLLGLAQGVNDVLMFGTLGIFFLLSFSVIIFMSFLFTTGDAIKAIMTTTWIAFTLSMFLLAMGLIPFTAMIVCLVCAAGSFGFSYLNR